MNPSEVSLEQIAAPIVLTEIVLSTGMTITVQESRVKLLARLNSHITGTFQVRMRNRKGDVKEISLFPRHIVLVGVETIWQEKAKEEVEPMAGIFQRPAPTEVPGVVNLGGKKQ